MSSCRSKLIDKAYFDMSLPIGEHQTISPPMIVAYMTGATRSAADRPRAGNRHRQRLSGGRAQPAGEGGLLDRNRRVAGQARGANAQAAEVQECVHEDRRRLSRLAGAGAVRQDHRHLLAGKGAAAAGRSAQGRRPDDHSGRRALSAGVPSPEKAERQTDQRSPAADALRAHDRQGRGGARATSPTRCIRIWSTAASRN